MHRFLVASFLTLIAVSALAVETVSSESAVSTITYGASTFGAPQIAVGTTKSYAVWTQGLAPSGTYGVELTATGRPAMETLTRLGPITTYFSKVFAAGDLFYAYGSESFGDFFLRRLDNGVTSHLAAITSFVYNGSRILLAGAHTELRDTDLNVVVPQVAASATAWTAAGGKFFGLINDPAAPRLISVDNDGHVQMLPASPTPAYSATLAGNGTELLHVWMQADRLLLYAQRYSLDGTVLSGVFAVGPSGTGPIKQFDVAASAGDFYVSWTEDSAADVPMYFRRVHGGSVSQPLWIDRSVTVPNSTLAPQFAGGAAGVFRTWFTPAAVIRRLDVAADTQPLVLRLPNQYEIKVASDGVVTLAAWVEEGRVRIGRIDAEGNLLDGAGIVVVPDGPANQHVQRVLFDGVNFFVLIPKLGSVAEENGLVARLVHRDGTFASGVISFPAADRGGEADAVWTGSAYRVWIASTGPKIVYVDVSTSGIAFAPVETAARNPATNFSVLWGQRPLYVPNLGGTFFDDLSNLVMSRDASIAGETYASPAATNGKDILMPWTAVSDYNATPFTAHFWLTRWDMKGNAIGLPWLVSAFTTPFRATSIIRVLADGANYKLLIEGGNQATLARLDDRAFACRCLDDVTEIPGLESGFDVASAGPDRTVIGYLRYVSEPGFEGGYRAFIRYTRAGPPRRHATGH